MAGSLWRVRGVEVGRKGGHDEVDGGEERRVCWTSARKQESRAIPTVT